MLHNSEENKLPLLLCEIGKTVIDNDIDNFTKNIDEFISLTNDVDTPINANHTLLFVVMFHNINFAKHLLERGATPNKINIIIAAVNHAAQTNNFDLLDLLISFKANISALLFIASDRKNPQLIKFLLSKGVSGLDTYNGISFLKRALLTDNSEFANLLLEDMKLKEPLTTLATIEEELTIADVQSYIIEACVNGRTEMLESAKPFMQRLNCDFNFFDDHDTSPLIRSALHGHQDMIIYLLANGAIPTLENKLRITAVGLLFLRKKYDILTYLLQRKMIDIDVGLLKESVKESCLTGNIDELICLLPMMAHTCLTLDSHLTCGRDSALSIAVDRNDLNLARFLLEQGASPEIGDDNQKPHKTTLTLATINNSFEMAELLLSYSARVNTSVYATDTKPIEFAADQKMVKLLESYGAISKGIHGRLLEIMDTLGYRIDTTDTKSSGGTCFGISYKAIIYILEGNLNGFYDFLLQLINYDLSYYKQLHHDLLNHETNGYIPNKKQIEILNFFDCVASYQSNQNTFDVECISNFELIIRDHLDAIFINHFVGFKSSRKMLGSRHETALQDYINKLEELFLNIDDIKLGVLVLSPKHAVTITYANNKWILIDINGLTKPFDTTAEFIKKVRLALNQDEHNIIDLKIYAQSHTNSNLVTTAISEYTKWHTEHTKHMTSKFIEIFNCSADEIFKLAFRFGDYDAMEQAILQGACSNESSARGFMNWLSISKDWDALKTLLKYPGIINITYSDLRLFSSEFNTSELRDFLDILHANNVDLHTLFSNEKDTLLLLSIRLLKNKFDLENILSRYDIYLPQESNSLMMTFAIAYRKYDVIMEQIRRGTSIHKSCLQLSLLLWDDSDVKKILLENGSYMHNLPYLVDYYLILLSMDSKNYDLAAAILIVKNYSLTKVLNECKDISEALLKKGDISAMQFMIRFDVNLLELKIGGKSVQDVLKENKKYTAMSFMRDLCKSCVTYTPSIGIFAKKSGNRKKPCSRPITYSHLNLLCK